MQNSQSIFDPTGDLFFPSLYFCIGLVAFIVVVGIAAEFLYFRPSLCKRREKGETWWLIKLWLHSKIDIIADKQRPEAILADWCLYFSRGL